MFSRDVVFYAIELTMLQTQGKGSVYSYTDAIISDWALKNIRAVEEAKKEKSDYKAPKKPKAQNKIVNYTGRSWDYDKLEKLAHKRLAEGNSS